MPDKITALKAAATIGDIGTVLQREAVSQSIARVLRINRDSVKRVVKRRAVHLIPQSSIHGSILDPFKEQVKEMLKRDPSCRAPAILKAYRVTTQRPREAF